VTRMLSMVTSIMVVSTKTPCVQAAWGGCARKVLT